MPAKYLGKHTTQNLVAYRLDHLHLIAKTNGLVLLLLSSKCFPRAFSFGGGGDMLFLSLYGFCVSAHVPATVPYLATLHGCRLSGGCNPTKGIIYLAVGRIHNCGCTVTAHSQITECRLSNCCFALSHLGICASSIPLSLGHGKKEYNAP